jgi:hypothetical protein
VIDISDPDNPEIVGSVQDTLRLDNANALVASDGYVYVAGVDYDAVVIVDVSTPTNPEIVKSARGALRTDQPPFGSPNGLTISDNSLYVSHGGGHSGIAVFDISDPERTHIIGSYTQSTGLGFSYGIQVVDELAYITPYDSDSLVIFDVSRSTSADPDISFYVYENDREPVFVKAEYRIGSCSVYEDTNYATFVSSTATSTYGISINNSAGDGRRIRDIEMSPSSDYPVSFATTTWLTSVDDAGAQEGNYCMFMTPYDGELEGERVEVEIVVDDPFTAPEIPVLSIFNKTQTSITLSWDVVGGVDHYIVSSTVTTTPTETTETSVTFAGLMSNTVYTFQIKAVDTFGNESAFSSAFEVETDEISSGGGGGGGGTTAPLPTTPSSTASSTYDNPSGLIRINDGAIYTRNRLVTVSFNTSFTDSYMLSEINDFSGKNYAPITLTTDFTLSAGDGEKRIYARFANQFGIYEAYDIIILDTASPQVPTLVPLTMPELIRRVDGTYVRRNASSTVRLRPVLSGTAEPNSRIVITLSSGLSVVQSVRLAAVQTFYTTTNESGAWSFAFPLDLENTTYTLSVQAEDSAGNISMPTQTILNLSSATPPEEPPCTTGCEPVEEEPPVDESPVCTVNCETEDIPENPPENVPEDSGDTSGETNTGEEGMGGGDESEGTAGGDTGSVEVGSSESAETPGNEEKTIQTVFSTASDSVTVVLGAVSGFAREVVEDVKNIPGVGRVVEVAEVVIQKTGEVIDNPVVEKTNQTYVAPALATAAVVNVAAGGVGLLSQVVMYLRLIFSQPLLLLRSKKQKTWGVVFNTYTKQPIDLALVRLVHDEKNNIIRTQVTDTKGRYFMVGGIGNYRLEADKEGFVLDATHGEDAQYTNVYAGGALALTAERNELNYNIPLQPADEKKTAEHILKEYGRVALHKTVSMVGAVATVVSFIISPNVWITGLLLAHIVLYRVMKRVAQKKVVGEYGVSVDADTNKKLEKVIVRVFEASYNKLVDTTITDAKGRYAILVGPGTYYLTAEKSGYELYKSENIDFSKERTNGVGGVIAENIVLKKSGYALTPPEKEIRVRTMPMI